MFVGRKPVAFLAVTLAVRQHEVVPDPPSIGPKRQSDLRAPSPQRPAIAVEAPTVLKIEQYRAEP